MASGPDEPVEVPWPLVLTPFAVLGFGTGLGLIVTTIVYDLSHWNAVAGVYAAEQGGSLPAQVRIHAWFEAIFLGATIVAALVLTVLTLVGRNAARLLLAAVCSPLLQCVVCALGEVIWGRSYAGGGHDETFPLWLGAASLIGVLLTLVAGSATTVLLLLPPTWRYFQARRS